MFYTEHVHLLYLKATTYSLNTKNGTVMKIIQVLLLVTTFFAYGHCAREEVDAVQIESGNNLLTSTGKHLQNLHIFHYSYTVLITANVQPPITRASLKGIVSNLECRGNSTVMCGLCSSYSIHQPCLLAWYTDIYTILSHLRWERVVVGPGLPSSKMHRTSASYPSAISISCSGHSFTLPHYVLLVITLLGLLAFFSLCDV